MKAAKAKKSQDHLGFDNDVLVCRNCGDRQQIGMPCAIGIFSAVVKTWSKLHRDCRPDPVVAAAAETAWKAQFERPMAWAAGNDTGISSKTLWSFFTGHPVSMRSTPFDPDDFGRCYRLLKAFPEWRARLHEVPAKHPDWTALVEAWAELEALFEAEVPDCRNRLHSGRAPKTYALMRKLRGEA